MFFYHGLVHDLWYFFFVLTFLYNIFYFKESDLSIFLEFQKPPLPNILTLISLAMYYTGSVNYMEVFKIFVEAQKTSKNAKPSVPTFFIT